ncbi:hypothetical protein TRIUR3_21863 [Triticum urartu]|uniref:Uncharacterized protein n=1 Tax=Triticum urartu TaxID=4572 RepID=M8A3C3_TRIUA|nr:hypothetical protein TRIUR3_21863 [Triticum urartu]
MERLLLTLNRLRLLFAWFITVLILDLPCFSLPKNPCVQLDFLKRRKGSSNLFSYTQISFSSIKVTVPHRSSILIHISWAFPHEVLLNLTLSQPCNRIHQQGRHFKGLINSEVNVGASALQRY